MISTYLDSESSICVCAYVWSADSAQAQSGTDKTILPAFISVLFVYGILSTCSTYMNNLSWCNSDPGQQYSLRIARASFLKSIGVTLYPKWKLVFNVLCTLTGKLRTTRLQSLWKHFILKVKSPCSITFFRVACNQCLVNARSWGQWTFFHNPQIFFCFLHFPRQAKAPNHWHIDQ